MKLSEAIRLGAMLKPQWRSGTMRNLGNTATCALGAAADARGIGVDSFNEFYDAFSDWKPLLLDRMVSHPVRKMVYRVWDCITSLNDLHGWTREAIADWVAGIEAEMAAEQAPEPAELVAVAAS